MELGKLSKDRNDEVSPWHEAFVNARKWVEKINLIIICKALSKGALFFIIKTTYAQRY
jgi:hypothetical protein